MLGRGNSGVGMTASRMTGIYFEDVDATGVDGGLKQKAGFWVILGMATGCGLGESFSSMRSPTFMPQ